MVTAVEQVQHHRDANKWKNLKKCKPREIGAGAIFYMAEMAVPGWEWRIYYDDAKVEPLLAEFHVLLGEPS
jgi:hypothetical protein